VIVSKGTTLDREAYSTFAGTGLAGDLRRAGIGRLFIGGLATDYCVLNSVRDAVADGFQVAVLRDAIAAVNVNAGDGARAEAEMQKLGARFLTAGEFADECARESAPH
jgi:nicotinamidase/pyrazinamidase